MTKSKILLYFSLSFIFGIFLDSIILISQLLMLGFLILGLILISVFWKYRKIAVIGFCLIFLTFGVWRHQTVELRIRSNNLKNYNDLEQSVILIGTVAREPDIRAKNIKLTVKVTQLNPVPKTHDREFLAPGYICGNFRDTSNKILVTTGRYPEYKYGDELEIKGKLETPAIFEDFNYKNYLAKNGIFSVMHWPEIKFLNRESYKDPARTIYKKILDFKDKLRESIYRNLSPPQSSILGAMILGDKSRLSENLKEKLNIAGIRHITAVSGMHVVILSSVLMPLLMGMGFWRGQAFYFSIVLIFLFVVMIGAHPSAIRAGIMGGLFLLGQKVGRKSFGPRAITMAAALMLAINPLLLLGDVGFQLSFLAAMGIIYLSPVFKRWFKFAPSQIRNILAMTLAAQIFTLPVLVYNFGRISLVAPLTNILILPIVYWIMLFGFILSLGGMMWQPLGLILSLPCWFLLTYLIKIMDFFSQPWAVRTVENVHWLWLVISYLIPGYFVWWLNKREKLKFLNY